MVVFGPKDTMAALELGAIDKLVIFEELTFRWVIVEHPASHETKILYLTLEQLDDPHKKQLIDEHGIELLVKDRDTVLIEWIIDNYKNFGAKLELVNDKSQEGF